MLIQTLATILLALPSAEPTRVPIKVGADRLFTEERRLQIVHDVLDRVSGAGVIRAAAATALPCTGAEMLSSFRVKKRDGSTVQVQAGSRQVTPGYFAALGQRKADRN